MSVRLQVLLAETEYREVQRAAKVRKMTVAAWVREALRDARQNQPSAGTDRKLAAIRASVKYEFPTGDIDSMLAEIESGYGIRS